LKSLIFLKCDCHIVHFGFSKPKAIYGITGLFFLQFPRFSCVTHANTVLPKISRFIPALLKKGSIIAVNGNSEVNFWLCYVTADSDNSSEVVSIQWYGLTWCASGECKTIYNFNLIFSSICINRVQHHCKQK